MTQNAMIFYNNVVEVMKEARKAGVTPGEIVMTFEMVKFDVMANTREQAIAAAASPIVPATKLPNGR